VHHDRGSLIDVTTPSSQHQHHHQQQQPGSGRRSPRDDRAVAKDATPETSSAGVVAAVGSGKRKSSPDERLLQL